MKIRFLLLLLILFSSNFSLLFSCEISAYFSPSTEVLDAIISRIENSENYIDLCIYTFTNRKLAYALANAKKNGIKVRVIMDHRSDRSNHAFTKSGFLRANGIEVKIMKGREAQSKNDWDGLMHHKFAIIDGNILLTGSLNWTASAISKNHENLMILENCDIIESYINEFERLWAKE